MSRVLVMHGIVPRVEPDRFAFRNLLDASAFEDWLRATPPCVSLATALAGRGTALTIDDATTAGAAAAVLARRLGHRVTLFVNPGQVLAGAPYAFVALNALMDALTGRSYVFDGQRVPTLGAGDRQALRRAIKKRLGSMRCEEDRLQAIHSLAAEWRVEPLSLPAHFATLVRADLVLLRDAGVDLQNHGWSHASHAELSADASREEVRAGRRWLEDELGVSARYFAVPFGDDLPRASVAGLCDAWLLSSMHLQPGPSHGGCVFNREELTLPSPAAGTASGGGRVARLARWLNAIAPRPPVNRRGGLI